MSKERIISFCERTIEFCFYILLAAVTFSTTLVEIAVSLAILAFAIKEIIKRDFKFLKLTPVKVLLAFFLWTVLSCFNSEYFSESFRGVFKVAEQVMVFIIAATSLRKEGTAKRAFYVMAGVVVVTCLNGIFQYFSGYDLIRHRLLIKQDYLRRISSSFIHPNDFGAFLVVMCTVFISLLLSFKEDLKNSLIAVIPAGLSVICLFLTKSRGAWLAFAAALLALGALKTWRVLCVFIIILLVVFILLPDSAQERIFSLGDLKSGTTWERLMLWKGTINMIKVHPVLGFGINTYSRNFPKYKPEEYPDYRYAHNCYLHMASEVGIIGAFLFLTLLFAVFFSVLRGVGSMVPGLGMDLVAGLSAGLAGFALNCAVDTHLYSVNLSIFFYLLLGFCFSLSYNSLERSPR